MICEGKWFDVYKDAYNLLQIVEDTFLNITRKIHQNIKDGVFDVSNGLNSINLGWTYKDASIQKSNFCSTSQ